MFVSYVRGVPTNWECPRKILHYTSENLWNWIFDREVKLSSERVIDACVYKMPDNTWKMWYKDEVNNSYSYTAYSPDLYEWKVGEAEITDCPHEGPNVFFFHEKYWMITDPWQGLGVYVSEDASHWNRCENILRSPGKREDDGTPGSHADVLVHNERAYIFYFTHPNMTEDQKNSDDFHPEYCHRRSSLQVAELIERDGNLWCDRDHVEIDLEVK